MQRTGVSLITILACSILMAGGNTTTGFAVDRQTSAVGRRAVPVSQADAIGDIANMQEPPTSSVLAPNFVLDWCSINGGGDVEVSSTNYRLGLSVGQSVAGEVASANYGMGIGFWYGATAGGELCPIVLTGDVNLNGVVNSADIIYLVGYVFKGGMAPQPCEAAGDVQCNGSVTSADIIYTVVYVFKSGPPPCDVCTLIPGTWTCP